MAIELEDLRGILTVLERDEKSGRGKLLILGSADVHISARDYRALASELGFRIRDVPDRLTPFALGEALGFQVTETLDVNGQATITHDLTQRLPKHLREKYDMIIDAGVLFWCFNPGLVLKNIFEAAKIKGKIVHITSVSGFYGRGYCNIHPKILDDFYHLNHCGFLGASFRARRFPSSLWKRILSRALALSGIGRKGVIIESSIHFGQVHLHYCGNRRFAFRSESPASHPPYVPCDILGFFAFQKGGYVNAVDPMLVLTQSGIKSRTFKRVDKN